MTKAKVTYSSAIETAIHVLEQVEGLEPAVIEKLSALKAQIDKRASADRKPTKTQKANEVIKADILAYLADHSKQTITDIIAGVPSLKDVSNQKATALVRQLKTDNKVIREEVKGRAFFSLA